MVWNLEPKTVMDSLTWGDQIKEGPLIYKQVYVWTDTFTSISDSIWESKWSCGKKKLDSLLQKSERELKYI